MNYNKTKTINHVSSILQGGAGNYMFQIAVAYAYGKRYNKKSAFNLSESRGQHQHLSTYDDNIFKDIDLYYVLRENREQFNEDGFHYQEIPNFLDKNILLHGYFQSEKYFKDCEKDIRKMFMSYDIQMSDEINNLLKNNNTCSIHIRRGDYLNFPDHHPTQNMNYYMKAIKKMPKDSMFLIFSDDIQWCKDNFPDMPEKFVFIEENKDYEDLYIMSHCNNNIICNSTFSWWGAWLNNNSEKIVISPSSNNWFGPAMNNYNTKDIIPEKWIQI